MPSSKAKDLNDLKKLVAKDVSDVLRFSENRDMKEKCYKFLNVTNYNDAEKAIYQQLVGPILNLKEENTKDGKPFPKIEVFKRKLDSLTEEAIKDLDSWN